MRKSNELNNIKEKYERYTTYTGGLMIGYDSNFLSEYIKKIGKLVLGNIDDRNKKDVEETLKKSLINGKTFYENAPEYIRKEMEEYEENLEKGIFID